MKKIKFVLMVVAASGLAWGMQSCGKALQDAKDNITSAEDFTSAETEFSGAFDITDDINQSDGKIKKGSGTVLPSGAVFTWVDSVMDSDGVKYDLDFGPLGATAPKGLLCGDGKYRAGKLHVSVSKPYATIGCSVSVSAASADEYYSGDGTNMFKVEGTLAITRSAAEQLDIAIVNGKVTDGAGKSATFQGNKSIVRTAGSGTPGIWGDVYEVTGNGSGVNREGDSYTWKITTALVKKMEVGCAKTFVKGVIEIKNNTANTSLVVDFDPYNNEACDRVARATFGTRSVIFTVR